MKPYRYVPKASINSVLKENRIKQKSKELIKLASFSILNFVFGAVATYSLVNFLTEETQVVKQEVAQVVAPPVVQKPTQLELQTNLVAWVKLHAKKPITDQFAGMVVKEAFIASHQRDLDPLIILALMRVESNFDFTAQSHAGAIGLMQIVPKWHMDKMPNASHIQDPKNNIKVGTQILAEYLKRSDGNMNEALLRYNGSLNIEGATYNKKVMSARANLVKFLDAKA